MELGCGGVVRKGKGGGSGVGGFDGAMDGNGEEW